MDKRSIRLCLIVSAILHVVGGALALAAMRQTRPRAVGVVEVTLLPMPGAVPDGRAPGDASGAEKPAGLAPSRTPMPRGKAALALRPRMRTTRILPPRRDVVAGRVAARPSLGVHQHDGKTGLAWTAPELATRRASNLAGLTIRMDPATTLRDGAGDPAAKPDADRMAAAALGTPEAPDAPLEAMPAPDFDLAGPVPPPPTPGTVQRVGGSGSGPARGQRGTGGATRNRGFLGQGVLGAYYADPQRPTGDYPLNMAFTFPTFSRLVTERMDPAIDFVWDMRPPAEGVPASYFSVRWRGRILAPVTADYVFYLDSLDDGARLFIDHQKVAESWMIQQGISVVRAVPLEAGIHEITVEYCQGPETHASIRLAWSSPSFGKETIRACPAPALPRMVAGIQRR